jgi:hypothetical protein
MILWRLRKKILEKQLQKAEAELMTAQHLMLPSNCFPVQIIREGSRWVCTFPCHPDPLQCVTAYGDSPLQATINFDNLWTGVGEIIETEEEEQF